MDAVYPVAASAQARGRRVRGAAPRLRHRTAPVTFAEIKEVDEEKEAEQEQTDEASHGSLVSVASVSEEPHPRLDLLGEQPGERLDREFAAFRRRRARRQPLRESDEPAAEPEESRAPAAGPGGHRSSSVPSVPPDAP